MRKTKEESEATKEKIIKAGLYVFLEKGFSKTSVEDIVKSVNLTRGAFYWHFKDKDELFKSIIEKEHAQRIVSLKSVTDENLDEKTQLKKFLANIIENFYDDERFRSFIKLRWFRVEHDPRKFSVPVTAVMNKTTESSLLDTLKSAKKKNLIIKRAVPEEITLHLIALTNGIFRLYFVGVEFYLKKERSLKIINDYIDLIFKK